MNNKTPVITFVGLSGMGKTTFLEKLIPILKARGICLAVIKHDTHCFEIDKPGKDSFRFAAAGADVVAISSAEKIAIIEKPVAELSLDDIISRLPKMDLILTEGYKKSPNKKIELHRVELNHPILCQPDELLAIVTNAPVEMNVPQIRFEDVEGCAEIIIRFMNEK
jgi:molybdopterin-guanine dinucleotide biosynthesis protein B